MKKLYTILSTIQLIVGTGALFGGAIAIIDPSGAMYGASTDILKTGPFTNFLIPGLFLFFILGMGHLISFIFVKHKFKFHIYVSGAAGCILMTWIVIQCLILNAIHGLHIAFFLIGLLESLIAIYMLFKLRLFPFIKKDQSQSL